MKHSFRPGLWLTMVLSLATLFVIFSCKETEESNIIYPESRNYEAFDIKDVQGTIYVTENKWKFHPDDHTVFYPWALGDEQGLSILISNMKEEYKKYNRIQVKISGKARFLHTILRQHPAGGSSEVFSVEIKDIEAITTTSRTRAGNTTDMLCGTPAPPMPSWYAVPRKAKAYSGNQSITSYTFNIFVHVIRSSSQDGYSINIANEIHSSLNSWFKNTLISFNLIGSEYIDNDTYYNITDDQALSYAHNNNGLFKENVHHNAIDIYIISNGINLEKTAGIAQSIPSTSLIIAGRYYNTPTLPHEIGHCLGLYHTHHGTSRIEQSKEGPELVNGSNSAIAGDFITDTPADPCIWSSWGTYNGTITDANGDHYNPDPKNIMSYNHSYRNRFSPRQIERMRETIRRSYPLRATCHENSITISAPDYIGEKADVSINVPSDYQVRWEVNCVTYTSYNGSSTTTNKTYNGTKFVLYNENGTATSQKYTIKANIITPIGLTFTANKVVYHIIPHANTGKLKWSSEITGKQTLSGFLDIGKPNNKAIKVYKGGYLYFYYYDASGDSSHDNKMYNFNVFNMPYLTKETEANHAFKCQNIADIKTYNSLLITAIGSASKMTPIEIQVLDSPYLYHKTIKDSVAVNSTLHKE